MPVPNLPCLDPGLMHACPQLRILPAAATRAERYRRLMADITQSQDDELEDDLEQGSKTVERIGLLAGPALAAAAYFSGPAMGLTADATAVFALLALMATWWVTMAVEPAVTGLVPFVALALLGIGKPAEIAAPYANDVMFLFGGGALLASPLLLLPPLPFAGAIEMFSFLFSPLLSFQLLRSWRGCSSSLFPRQSN